MSGNVSSLCSSRRQTQVFIPHVPNGKPLYLRIFCTARYCDRRLPTARGPFLFSLIASLVLRCLLWKIQPPFAAVTFPGLCLQHSRAAKLHRHGPKQFSSLSLLLTMKTLQMLGSNNTTPTAFTHWYKWGCFSIQSLLQSGTNCPRMAELLGHKTGRDDIAGRFLPRVVFARATCNILNNGVIDLTQVLW